MRRRDVLSIAGAVAFVVAGGTAAFFFTRGAGARGDLAEVCLSQNVAIRDAARFGQSLWRPEEPRFFNAEAATAFRAGRTITLFSVATPWQLPLTPTWREDPFGLASWRLYYNALGWMHALFYDYARNGNKAALDEAKRLLFDWMATHDASGAKLKDEAWADHPTAYRLANLVRFAEWLDPILTTAERKQLQAYIAAHAAYLITLFPLPFFFGTNHGFMDAMAVYTTGFGAENVPGAPEWRRTARDRLNQLLREMFFPDGVDREQSFGYQAFVIGLVYQAECLLRATGGQGLEGFGEVARKALEFSAVARSADGSIPAIGDTNHGQPAGLAAYFNERTTTPVASWIRTGKGEPPPPLVLYRDAGYAVIWPDRAANDLSLVFDFSPPPATHGHQDALNFTLFAGGHPLVVDSGGPYAYGSDILRQYFRASRAHNVVLVDDQSSDAGAKFIASGDRPDRQWVSARTRIGDVEHKRTVIVLSAEIVVVHDVIRAPAAHHYDLLYHLAPDGEVAAGEVTTARFGDASLSVQVFGADNPVPTVIKGREGPDWRGWVTPAILSMVPAPVLQYSTEAADADFVTVLGPSKGDAAAPKISYSSGHLQIDAGGKPWLVDLTGAKPKIGR